MLVFLCNDIKIGIIKYLKMMKREGEIKIGNSPIEKKYGKRPKVA